MGLRIESSIRHGEASPPSQLEVQEIRSDIVRLEQAEQSPSKPPRQVTFQQLPPTNKDSQTSHGEGANWGAGHHHSTRWLLGSGAAVFAIVVTAMILLPFINKPNAPTVPRPGAQAKLAGLKETNETDVLRGLFTKQAEALQIFRSYITASNVDEIVPLVRDGATMTELLAKTWQPSTVQKSWSPPADSSWTLAEQNGQAYGILQGTMPDGSKFTAYFSHKNDRLQLDWKATTAYCSATFAQLEKNQGNPAEIRGVISPANFYTAVWPEADYQSYRLLSADGVTFIWCYARRDSPANESITLKLRKSNLTRKLHGSCKITLQLERGPDGAPPNQWLIGEMLHLDWISP